MSRIDAGNFQLDEIPSDIRQAFHFIDATMLELARGKNIALSFMIGNVQDRYVYMDVIRYRRVLVNIISNALKYTRSGGYVKVKCEQVGRKDDKHGLYCFTVEDNGIGMSPEFQKHAFDEFTREMTATASGVQGTGLGLALCKKFVSMMHGTIECRSHKGEGTTFTVTLPFRLQSEAEIAAQTKAQAIEPVNQGWMKIDLHGSRVLLVEDNELNREIATEILEEEGMKVETANDGAFAVKIMKEKGPDYFDFILMDIQMPIMNGYEATTEIRKMYPGAKIPIIALSANAFAEDVTASLAVGMNAHLAKPLDVKELMKTLRRMKH